jgi:hypothetical protein
VVCRIDLRSFPVDVTTRVGWEPRRRKLSQSGVEARRYRLVVAGSGNLTVRGSALSSAVELARVFELPGDPQSLVLRAFGEVRSRTDPAPAGC